jgi:DNA-binding MltR family transcriptional regulator
MTGDCGSTPERANPLDDPDLKRILEQGRLLHAETDRGAVLVAAAILDELLKGILLGFLVDCDTSKQLLSAERGGGKLSEYFARTNVAYALGLISKSEMKKLLALGTLRNQFAHRWQVATFTHLPEGATQLDSLLADDVEIDQPLRSRFNNVAVSLLFALESRKLEASRLLKNVRSMLQ